MILLHGSWLGGWVWADVAARLRADGHVVETPTIIGCGERAEEAGVATLSGAIEELALLLRGREPAVVVAHSYAGVPTLCVAGAQPRLVKSLVLLDAVVPQHEKSVADIYPADRVAQAISDAQATGTVPPIDPAQLAPDLSADGHAALAARLRPMPLALLTEAARLENGGLAGVRFACAYCTNTLPTIRPFADAAARLGETRWLEAGHLAMLSRPAVVADFIGQSARP
jgi:pimeloyl-ACP methyl ester carboxylesterase